MKQVVTIETSQGAARRPPIAIIIIKTAFAVAGIVVVLLGMLPMLHGSSSVAYRSGTIIWSEIGVPVEPTARLDLTHLRDNGPSSTLFPRTETTDGSKDSATGLPPIEYTFAAPRMHLPAPTVADKIYFAGPPLLGDVIVLIVIGLLWRAVGSLRAEVFTRANSRRMVTIGLLIGLGLSATALLTYFGQVAIVDRSAAAGQLTGPLRFSFVPLLAGAVIVVFAEVFRRGVAMRQDLETVI